MKKNFLIEIGTEELPTKKVQLLSKLFCNNFKKQLKIKNFKYNQLKWYATSRRIALKITDLKLKNKKKIIKIKKNSNYKQKIKKTFKLNLISFKKIKKYIIEKINFFLLKKITKHNKKNKILINLTLNSINNLPIQNFIEFEKKKIKFIRPVKSLTILFGNKLVEGNIFNVNSKRLIYGHKTTEKKLLIQSADQYPSILYQKSKIIANYELRKFLIKKKIIKTAKKINGIVNLKNFLLEELTSLIESPTILYGKFNKNFLCIPKEALLYILEKKQKYIPVYNKKNNLINHFIFISNINNLKKRIILWNEKVLHSILLDAKYFYKKDRKKKLEEFLPKLKKILFQNSLGNLYEKSIRIKILSKWIANQIQANPKHSSRAAILSKCDLITNMVVEFNEIKGFIGMNYALQDGEEKNVAIAIQEHYKPNFSNEKISSNKISNTVSLADKFDTLVGIIGINKKTTGNQDPFGLRRITNGILRIIIENKYELNLQLLIEQCIKLYNKKILNFNTKTDVINFILNRLYKFYQNLGYQKNIIKSVLNYNISNLMDFDSRIKSVYLFSNSKSAKNLMEINKRISNILKKSTEKINNIFSIKHLKIKEEIDLTNQFFLLKKKIPSLIQKRKYEKILFELSKLNELINSFFKKVYIFDKDKIIQTNRLILLKKIKKTFSKIANISLLN